jgi:phenylacetic acid degradation operon negative regulatory protein
VESDERGLYRLAPAAAPLSAHVEAWRRGERRVRPWSGEWLAVWLPKSAARAARRRSERALERVGYRAALGGIWVRPDNLAEPRSTTSDKLAELGLEPGAQAFVAHAFEAELTARWRRDLWQPAKLAAAQRAMRKRLELSRDKVAHMPTGPAAVETFLIGGAAIRLLSTDPLLPAEIADLSERAALTEAMLEYDLVGRTIWAGLGRDAVHQSAPAHLSLAGGLQ